MADLTGAELAEATAYVLGFRDDDHRWRHSGAFYIHRRPNETMPEEWRPDHGGAAAWEVLEWVRQQGWDVGLRCVELCLDSDEPVTESVLCTLRATRPVRECQAIGPTDAIALCRAVVALGEAG